MVGVELVTKAAGGFERGVVAAQLRRLRELVRETKALELRFRVQGVAPARGPTVRGGNHHACERLSRAQPQVGSAAT
jgi:hypothetical protein